MAIQCCSELMLLEEPGSVANRAKTGQGKIRQTFCQRILGEEITLAARLWTMFGNKQQANAVRAEARRTFADPSRARARAARH